MDLFIPDNSLDSISFTVQEVFDALTNLNPLKASTIDNILATVLKNCAHALAQPIIHYLLQPLSIVEPYLVNEKSTK